MKILKYLLILIICLGIGAFVAVKVMSDKLPEASPSQEADALADAVMRGLGKAAFDTIPYLSWEFFRPGQKYFWDKKQNNVVIEWGDNKVVMNLDSQMARSSVAGVAQEGAAHEKLKQKAWSNWCNDSFWLIAPFKMKDRGTVRKLVPIENSSNKGLLVEYVSGGVTPGDSYLWEIGPDNKPVSWKMWTKILPVKGMLSPWSGWENHMGAQLSTKHAILGKEVVMKDVKSGNDWSEFGYKSDPFKELR